MDIIVIFGFAWLLHLIPALMGSIPLWLFWRNQVHWLKWEFVAVLTAPFLVWLCLYLTGLRPKSITNMVAESLILGFAIPVAAVIRLLFVGRFTDVAAALSSLIFLCLVAVALWYFIPELTGK